MSFPSRIAARFLAAGVTLLAIAACVVLIIGHPRVLNAQENQKAVRAMPATDSTPTSRGKYLVEDVAMCGTCHTPHKPNGELDHSRWLAGGSVPYLPAQPTPDWPTIAPRLAGLPPASNAGMVTLLTTGVWITGKPLRDPMPKFHMTRADAEAVLAYLKSLPAGQ
jgi:mono/diheme cytochrome c family protein